MKALCAKLLTVSLFIAAASAAARGEDAPPSVALTGLDGQQATITLAELDALPRVTLNVEQHGAVHSFEGALLGDVLKKVGAPSGKAIHGAELADVVIVQARDGYTVALDLAETDAVIRPERVILADREDGSALSPESGPFQLVVEGDLRPARSARMVSTITLKRMR
ncbi:MAG: molybdopterin-dependent oxidoreductase [Methylocella sp.]